MYRSDQPLVGADVVEHLCPAVVVASARAVTVGYRPIAANRYLRSLAGDVQRLEHSRVRVCHGPGEALSLSVLFQLLNALGRARADYVKGDPILVVCANLLLDAP